MSEEQARSFIEQATQSLQAGQLNQALDFANQAIMLDPTNADAFSLKAVALAQLNQNAEATRAFEEAIQLQPENSKVRYNLAVHLVRQNQKIEGLGQAREALRLDPSHAGARELVTQLERELGVAAEPRPEGHAAPPEQTSSPYGGNPYATPSSGAQSLAFNAPTETRFSGDVAVGVIGIVMNTCCFAVTGLASFGIAMVQGMGIEEMRNQPNMDDRSLRAIESLGPMALVLAIGMAFLAVVAIVCHAGMLKSAKWGLLGSAVCNGLITVMLVISQGWIAVIISLTLAAYCGLRLGGVIGPKPV